MAIARALTNTFAGIRPVDVPAFVIAEFAGALVALTVTNWLMRVTSDAAPLNPEAQL